MKDFLKMLGDVYYSITKKFDSISQMIYERTGKKYNVGLIIVIVALIIFTLIFVKALLGWLITLI